MTVGVSSVANCVNCGGAVTAATSFMTEHGLMCWPCSARMQNQQEATARERAERERSLGRRATINGRAHGVMWGVTIILATHWTRIPSWVGTTLLIGAAALMFGLALGARWAYRVALAIDIAGGVALIVAGATIAEADASAFVMLLAIFPFGLSAMVWTLRAAYFPTPRHDGGEIGPR